MLTIYVGDSRNVVRRIRCDHCNGNVEASALRRHVAEMIGYTFTKTRRESGSRRIRLNLPEPQGGEQVISDYLRSAVWKYILCESYEEAHDFQWYCIDRLRPHLNSGKKKWDERNAERYLRLLNNLVASTGYSYTRLDQNQTGPGVYVLYHSNYPGP